jgi:hypothetical protein
MKTNPLSALVLVAGFAGLVYCGVKHVEMTYFVPIAGAFAGIVNMLKPAFEKRASK